MEENHHDDFEPAHYAKLDPLCPDQFTDFDWDELYRAVGDSKATAEIQREFAGVDRERIAHCLHEILVWAVRSKNFATIGRRIVALTWVLNQDAFEGAPPITKLAQKFGLHRAGLSDDTADARRTFGVQNRAQSHDWHAKQADVSR